MGNQTEGSMSTLRTALEQFATDLEKALAVPTNASDAETRGYDNATRDTLTRVREILAGPE